MDSSSRLLPSASRTQSTPSLKTAPVNIPPFKKIQPKVSPIKSPSSSQSKSVTFPRHQNWRQTEKYFSLLSTAACGSFEVSPWARGSSPEGCPRLPRTTTASTDSDIDSSYRVLSLALPDISPNRSTLAAETQNQINRAESAKQPEEKYTSNFEEGKRHMSQPPPSSRLRRLTEVPPPLLPELPRPKRIPAAASQSVLSSFFHPIDTPSQSEKSSVYGDGRQKRRASLPYSPHHSRGSTGDMLSLSMATNEIEPTIKSDRTMYIENNEHDQQYQNSSQSNLINIQEDVITKSSASYTPSRILKDSALEPVATSTLVTLPTNSNTESRVDATEFIPSTLEMPLCVQTTHISTEGYEQGISTQSPTLSSSMCSSFPESNDIVFNSMDQHSPLVSSPAPSVKRSGSSTSSRSRKQNDKRKKAIQTASSETIGESPASSQHISSTALFEANMADIERYVDQDLYGYNNLSY